MCAAYSRMARPENAAAQNAISSEGCRKKAVISKNTPQTAGQQVPCLIVQCEDTRGGIGVQAGMLNCVLQNRPQHGFVGGLVRYGAGRRVGGAQEFDALQSLG